MGQRLVDRLIEERDQHIDHALFYWTQILMAYNSNHMEGSTLTAEQTSQIFESDSLLAADGEQIRVDDVIETRNHFVAFNYMLDHVDDPVNEEFVCHLHWLLKKGTSQESDSRYHIGAYKNRENEISQILGLTSIPTVAAVHAPEMMEVVFNEYARITDNPVHIAMCHWMFERVHPFSDGNGRVGRLVMFKECLRLNTVPPLVRDEHHSMYVKGLNEFPEHPGWLVDLLLSERDTYEQTFMQRMAQGQLAYTYADHWSEQDSEVLLDQSRVFAQHITQLAPSPETVNNLSTLYATPSAVPVRQRKRHIH